MKITLDLSDLVARGKLSADEAERLQQLAAEDTGSLGANILLGFGVVAVALGVGVLLPSPITAIVLGAILFAAGLSLKFQASKKWQTLSEICLTVGALAMAGGAAIQFDGGVAVELGITLGLAVAAVLARSGLLAALTMLALGAVLGSGAAYFHALYAFWTPHPALTIGVFSVVTLALYLASLRLPADYERLALIAARTAILLINAAFLIGSLFGDDDLHWPDLVFVIGWAVVLVVVGGWAVTANRRWVVNVAAVFGTIHFYTQWFERLGPSPVSILGGGLLLIGFGIALRAFNRPKGPGSLAATAVSAAPGP